MKKIKVYLIVVTVLLFVSIFFSIYIWVAIQDLHKTVGRVPVEVLRVEQSSESTTQPTELKTKESVTERHTPEPVTISLKTLPPAQRALLENLGYTDTIVITDVIQKCVREKIGLTRYQEIIGGATPSTKELFIISPCLAKL